MPPLASKALPVAVLLLVVGLGVFVTKEVAYLTDPCIFRGDEQPPPPPGGLEECRVGENTYQYQWNHRPVSTRIMIDAAILAVVGLAVGLLVYGIQTQRPRLILWGTTLSIATFSPLATHGSWSVVPLLVGILALIAVGIARARALVRMSRAAPRP